MSNLYRLAYISKNTIPGSKEQVSQQIEDILQSAHRNNSAKGISGALLYSGGYFCQVIEGGEEDIEELFETIQMDSRHGEVRVLEFVEIPERGFAEWAMALAGIEETDSLKVEGILNSKDEMQMALSVSGLVQTMESLVKQHQQLVG